MPIGDQRSIVDGLRALTAEAANLDIKALAGHPGWFRLRIGDWRVVYFSDPPGIVVERIVNRRDLERSLESLP